MALISRRSLWCAPAAPPPITPISSGSIHTSISPQLAAQNYYLLVASSPKHVGTGQKPEVGRLRKPSHQAAVQAWPAWRVPKPKPSCSPTLTHPFRTVRMPTRKPLQTMCNYLPAVPLNYQPNRIRTKADYTPYKTQRIQMAASSPTRGPTCATDAMRAKLHDVNPAVGNRSARPMSQHYVHLVSCAQGLQTQLTPQLHSHVHREALLSICYANWEHPKSITKRASRQENRTVVRSRQEPVHPNRA